MRRTLVLRLFHSQVAAAAGSAEIIIPNNCTIVGVVMNVGGIGGAGTGVYAAELSLNNNSTTWADTNNAPREATLASHRWSYLNANAAVNAGSGWIPLNVPLRAGERISINQTLSGTAASTNRFNCDVFVVE